MSDRMRLEDLLIQRVESDRAIVQEVGLVIVQMRGLRSQLERHERIAAERQQEITQLRARIKQLEPLTYGDDGRLAAEAAGGGDDVPTLP